MNVNLVNLKDDSDMTSLKDIQENDAEIFLVRSWVESSETPNYMEISSSNYFIKSLWGHGLDFRLFDSSDLKTYLLMRW